MKKTKKGMFDQFAAELELTCPEHTLQRRGEVIEVLKLESNLLGEHQRYTNEEPDDHFESQNKM